MLLPARTAVLNQLYRVGCQSVPELMDALKPAYGGERQFTKKLYAEHCMALEANGLVEMASYELDADSNLAISYQITEDGRHTVEKYVAREYRQPAEG